MDIANTTATIRTTMTASGIESHSLAKKTANEVLYLTGTAIMKEMLALLLPVQDDTVHRRSYFLND